MKKILTVIIAVLAIAFILLVAKDMIIKSSVEGAVRTVTGLRLSIDEFKVGLSKSTVHVEDMVLFNPVDYQDRVMCVMPEIYIEYDLPAIIKGNMHLPNLLVNLQELTVVKNEKGELNLNALNVVKEQKQDKKSPQKKNQGLKMQVDLLELKIGKVIYKDYSMGKRPQVMEYKINLDEKYRNITDVNALARLIIVKAITNTAIANIANFDLQGLTNAVSGTFQNAGQMASQVTQQAQTAVKGTMKATTDAAKEARQVARETAKTLTQALTLPFGGAKSTEEKK
ncbi:MAG: hypothetical protein JW946_04080 [Candidatus Omnitrophica bacterium]|nr:hypothetical protein [Candidatus Omnitrophota bacterium]